MTKLKESLETCLACELCVFELVELIRKLEARVEALESEVKNDN